MTELAAKVYLNELRRSRRRFHKCGSLSWKQVYNALRDIPAGEFKNALRRGAKRAGIAEPRTEREAALARWARQREAA